MRIRTAFKAGDLALRELHAPHTTLELLDAAHVDAQGSSLRERALLLRIEALARIGQSVDAHAAIYLRDYPDSAGAVRVRVLSKLD